MHNNLLRDAFSVGLTVNLKCPVGYSLVQDVVAISENLDRCITAVSGMAVSRPRGDQVYMAVAIFSLQCRYICRERFPGPVGTNGLHMCRSHRCS